MDLITQLKRDEGLRLTPYKDTRGYLTVGYGHNLEVAPITEAQADEFLRVDAQVAEAALLKHLPWVANLDEPRRGALINMAFNLGILGILQFHRTITCMQDGAWEIAAEAMLESVWAKQVGARAERLAVQVRTGVWQ